MKRAIVSLLAVFSILINSCIPIYADEPTVNESRFDGRESDGLYIVNVHGFAVKNNWCARGFITYHDGNELITHYTNQINTTTSNTNNNRGTVSRSLLINDSDDADNDNNGGGIGHDYYPEPF